MKHWKLVLGAGAACAACCAAPILGGAAALGIGSGLFAWGVGTFAVAMQSWAALVAGGVLLAALAGAVAWRRRLVAPPAAACGCPGGTCAGPKPPTEGRDVTVAAGLQPTRMRP
jgi:hypothetical protein